MNARSAIVIAGVLFGSLTFAANEKPVTESRVVVVEFVVGSDGRPTKIKVVETADQKLADSVVAAVSKWQLDGKYAGKKMRQPVEFQLGDDAAKDQKANRR